MAEVEKKWEVKLGVEEKLIAVEEKASLDDAMVI